MTWLAAIQTLNTALAFGVNGLSVARKIGSVMEAAQREDRPINEDEWKSIVGDADRADARLAAAIRGAD